jgi:hypothetical protein
MKMIIFFTCIYWRWRPHTLSGSNLLHGITSHKAVIFMDTELHIFSTLALHTAQWQMKTQAGRSAHTYFAETAVFIYEGQDRDAQCPKKNTDHYVWIYCPENLEFCTVIGRAEVKGTLMPTSTICVKF